MPQLRTVWPGPAAGRQLHHPRRGDAGGGRGARLERARPLPHTDRHALETHGGVRSPPALSPDVGGELKRGVRHAAGEPPTHLFGRGMSFEPSKTQRWVGHSGRSTPPRRRASSPSRPSPAPTGGSPTAATPATFCVVTSFGSTAFPSEPAPAAWSAPSACPTTAGRWTPSSPASLSTRTTSAPCWRKAVSLRSR